MLWSIHTTMIVDSCKYRLKSYQIYCNFPLKYIYNSVHPYPPRQSSSLNISMPPHQTKFGYNFLCFITLTYPYGYIKYCLFCVTYSWDWDGCLLFWACLWGDWRDWRPFGCCRLAICPLCGLMGTFCEYLMAWLYWDTLAGTI